jgi:hypothetical protein
VVAGLSDKQGTDSGRVLEVPASSPCVMTLDSSVGGDPGVGTLEHGVAILVSRWR